MKKLILFSVSTFALLLVGTSLFAQQEKKEKKEVVIIKEVVDKDGNVTVEKIVRDAEPGEIIIDENGTKTIKVEVTSGGMDDEDVIIIKDGELMNAKTIEEEMDLKDVGTIDVKVEVNEDGEQVKKVIVTTKDGGVIVREFFGNNVSVMLRRRLK